MDTWLLRSTEDYQKVLSDIISSKKDIGVCLEMAGLIDLADRGIFVLCYFKLSGRGGGTVWPLRWEGTMVAKQ